MNIPFLDLSLQYNYLKSDIQQSLDRVCHSSDFILGSAVTKFESEFAEFLNSAHVIGVANGTDALYLGYKAFKVGPGDEVILPANTFIATALAVIKCGAKPVLVDCDPHSYLIDTEQMQSCITSSTRVLCPVSLYGMAVDMEKITQIANRHQLLVFEDSAQAHGARFKNRAVGTWGNLGAFSFYPGKNLGAFGDAGAVCTDDSDLAETIRMLRNYGYSKKYYYGAIGENSRLDTLQAAVLSVKLKHLKAWNLQRWHSACKYTEKLSSLEQAGLVQLPQLKSAEEHVFHLYTIQTNKRNELQQFLLSREIQTGIHYPNPFYLQEAYQGLGYQKGDFPYTESIAERTLSLPLFPGMTEDQIHYVCDNILEFLNK
ncbi:MAG: DegT/DnrJ/EryC1/StrS family aminotransferase [Verrucomicrobiota bacterium]